MSRIINVFKLSPKKTLIAYITVGYPDVETTIRVARLLAENGADIIELGIPFSDPLADGMTIQLASYRALQNGVALNTCLSVITELRQHLETPLVFMSYLNPIYKYGIANFCKDCARVGIDGLIIPDLPPEEGETFERLSRQHGIDLIYLLASTSTSKRIKLVTQHSQGFVYLVSEVGVTGTRKELPADLKDFVSRVRKATNKPLCVGFGISTPEQAATVSKIANGVIIGSKILQTIESDKSLRNTRNFISKLRHTMDQTSG
jgi:tryptophan synthase alpha chain